jgi:xanthine/uracil/vitamin C permease (AzgA family)
MASNLGRQRENLAPVRVRKLLMIEVISAQVASLVGQSTQGLVQLISSHKGIKASLWQGRKSLY